MVYTEYMKQDETILIKIDGKTKKKFQKRSSKAGGMSKVLKEFIREFNDTKI